MYNFAMTCVPLEFASALQGFLDQLCSDHVSHVHFIEASAGLIHFIVPDIPTFTRQASYRLRGDTPESFSGDDQQGKLGQLHVSI